MSFRPDSSSGRPGSRGGLGGGAGRPPGTATRLMTGMAGQKQPVMGGGLALTSQLNVAERPVTQQGLGGMKTGASRGPHRQVQDRTYFIGVLRSKINELQQETRNLKAEVNVVTDDQSNYVAYEKKAELLAVEHKKLTAEMQDYNTLVDKLTTEENISDIQMDCEDLKATNDKLSNALDALFEQKKQREELIQKLDMDLQQERSLTDTLIADMNPDMRQKYLEMKDMNDHLLKQLEMGQQELDRLNFKKQEMDDELSASPVKQEAVRQYEQLHELEEKRDQLLEEQKARVSPQEEREKLLKQVKEDNQETTSIERQIKEVQEKIAFKSEELSQLNMDIEENQGERNQKYKELKKREETMNEFMDAFEETKKHEMERMAQLEQNTTLILEHMSRNLSRVGHMPTMEELTNMKEDLTFKESEMANSKYTASGLAGESEKLHQDLGKVELLESKITSELDLLRERIDQQTAELAIFEDLDKVRTDGEKKKQQLGEDKVNIHRRRQNMQQLVQRLSAEYEALKAQLNDNETYNQLANLERKWQSNEQNNFVMHDFIASKQSECDTANISKKLKTIFSTYNSHLQSQTSHSSY